jgi:hypothetical protein
MSLGELQISFPLFFVPKIHLMTSYPETLTVKKLIKMRFFTIKIHMDQSLFMAGGWKRKGLGKQNFDRVKGWVNEKQNNSRVG